MPQHISKKKINFHKTPTGGGSPFYETFSQNRFFLKDGFPNNTNDTKVYFMFATLCFQHMSLHIQAPKKNSNY